jgi:hypothetical protein
MLLLCPGKVTRIYPMLTFQLRLPRKQRVTAEVAEAAERTVPPMVQETWTSHTCRMSTRFNNDAH